MDWQAEIAAAAVRIAPFVRVTPVMQVDLPGFGPVALKLENTQHTGSFKVRGAFNTLLSNPVPQAGVVAASGGNHGAAVAFAARTLGHPAKIFVPEYAGPAKIALIRAQGADLAVVPGVYADAAALALAHAKATGAMQIHPYDAPATVAGQGTLMLEWEAQGLQADTVLIAVGGGGLLAGAAQDCGGRTGFGPDPEPRLGCRARDGGDGGRDRGQRIGGQQDRADLLRSGQGAGGRFRSGQRCDHCRGTRLAVARGQAVGGTGRGRSLGRFAGRGVPAGQG